MHAYIHTYIHTCMHTCMQGRGRQRERIPAAPARRPAPQAGSDINNNDNNDMNNNNNNNNIIIIINITIIRRAPGWSAGSCAPSAAAGRRGSRVRCAASGHRRTAGLALRVTKGVKRIEGN